MHRLVSQFGLVSPCRYGSETRMGAGKGSAPGV